MTDLEALRRNSLIESIKPLTLDEDIKEIIRSGESGQKGVLIAEEYASQVDFYAIAYHSQGHLVNGFMAVPKSGENLPCLIVNRGGSKDFSIWQPDRVIRGLGKYASWGYIAIASQYSGCAGSEGKDEWGGGDVQDILIFKELLDEFARADTSRTGMTGASRGGLMVYRALAEVNWIKAAVSRAGVSNVFRSHQLRPGLNNWHADMFDIDSEEEMKKRSAVFWADKFCKTTPLLMIHGTADDKVSPLDSIELAGKLYENEVPFRLHIIEGDDHYLAKHRQLESEMIHGWVDRFVRDHDALPDLAVNWQEKSK